MSKVGLKSEAIAKQISCSGRTVRRELSRGRTELLNSDYTTRIEYCADIGQKRHDYEATAKGTSVKIANDYKLVEYIENLIIKEKYSPHIAAQMVKKNAKNFSTTICTKQYITI